MDKSKPLQEIDTKILFDDHQFGNKLGLYYYLGYNEIRKQPEFVVVVKAIRSPDYFRVDGNDSSREIFRHHLSMKGETMELFSDCSNEQKDWLQAHFNAGYCFEDCQCELEQLAKDRLEFLSTRTEHGLQIYFQDLEYLERRVKDVA